jgi:hypothetical protein
MRCTPIAARVKKVCSKKAALHLQCGFFYRTHLLLGDGAVTLAERFNAPARLLWIDLRLLGIGVARAVRKTVSPTRDNLL